MTQIVKLGGSTITDDEGTVRTDAVERLAREAATADELVLVHGAGSMGHPLTVEHGLDDGIADEDAREALATVHANVRELNLAVLDALRQAGRPAVVTSPFGTLASNDGRPGGWNLVPVHRMLGHDLVPVTHGDLVLDTTRGVSALSGDTLCAELARFLDADRVVFALDQDGVYTHPPEDEDAELLERPTPDELDQARKRATSPDADATGGMVGKLDEAVRAVRTGAQVCLVNGLEPGRLEDALAGKPEGTVLEPGGPGS